MHTRALRALQSAEHALLVRAMQADPDVLRYILQITSCDAPAAAALRQHTRAAIRWDPDRAPASPAELRALIIVAGPYKDHALLSALYQAYLAADADVAALPPAHRAHVQRGQRSLQRWVAHYLPRAVPPLRASAPGHEECRVYWADAWGLAATDPAVEAVDAADVFRRLHVFGERLGALGCRPCCVAVGRGLEDPVEQLKEQVFEGFWLVCCSSAVTRRRLVLPCVT